MFRSLITILLTCFVNATITNACFICCVNVDAPSGGDGYSWSTAYNDLNDALSDNKCRQIWVAQGTYVGNFFVRPYVELYGGFAGRETELSQRNWVLNQTVLDGDFIGSVVTVANGSTLATCVDGFTITNGNGTLGDASTFGGGIYLNDASPTICNTVIVSNHARFGGGIAIFSAAPTIVNTVIVGNTATYGAGIYMDDSWTAIVNATIVGNTARARNAGGIYLSDSSPFITNTILAFNPVYHGIAVIGQCVPVFDHNLIDGKIPFGLIDPTAINFAGNPLFVRTPTDGGDGWGDNPLTSEDESVNDDLGDLHLLFGSPCIDSGNNLAVPNDFFDLDDNGNNVEPIPFDLNDSTRFFDDLNTVDRGIGTPPIVDIGAYEYMPIHRSGIIGDNNKSNRDTNR